MTSSSSGQERINELQSEVLDWQLLHEVSTRLIQVSSLREQLEIVLQAATRLSESTCGLISLYSHEEDCLTTFVSQGLGRDALAAVSHVAIGSGACGLSFLEKSRVIRTRWELLITLCEDSFLTILPTARFPSFAQL